MPWNIIQHRQIIVQDWLEEIEERIRIKVKKSSFLTEVISERPKKLKQNESENPLL